MFSDGTNSKTLSCTILPKTLTCPSSPDDKTYTGSSQNSGITCPNGSTAGGTQSAINAGEYTQICTANTNYQFASNCSVNWKIKKRHCDVGINAFGKNVWTSDSITAALGEETNLWVSSVGCPVFGLTVSDTNILSTHLLKFLLVSPGYEFCS